MTNFKFRATFDNPPVRDEEIAEFCGIPIGEKPQLAWRVELLPGGLFPTPFERKEDAEMAIAGLAAIGVVDAQTLDATNFTNEQLHRIMIESLAW